MHPNRNVSYRLRCGNFNATRTFAQPHSGHVNTTRRTSMRRHEDTRSNTRTQLSSKHAVLGAAIAIFASLAVIGPARADDSAVEWKPERAPTGPTMIVVGLQEQRAQVYRNGVRIASTPVSTGKPGHETPTGLFSI